MSIKVGIIGLGNVGQKHLNIFLKNKHCQVIGVCDFNKKILIDVKKKFKKLKIFKDAKELINDKQINTVSICSYDNFHFDQALSCIKRKKNIFCEKPICLTYQEYKILKRKLAHYMGHFGTNFNLRTSQSFIELKKKINQKKLGKIFHVEAGYESGRLFKIESGWRGKTSNTSIIHGGMIHMIDLVLWLLNKFNFKKKVQIFSEGNRLCSEHFKYKNDDFVSSLIKIDKILINLKASWGCVVPHFHSLKVYGTKGTFINDFQYKGYFLKKNKNKFIADNLNYKNRDKGKTIDQFIKQIKHNTNNKNAIDEILKVTKLSMEIKNSLLRKNSRKVYI